MDAAAHLAVAEQLLEQIASPDAPADPTSTLALALEAQAHALIALAAETGVVHPAAPAAVPGG